MKTCTALQKFFHLLRTTTAATWWSKLTKMKLSCMNNTKQWKHSSLLQTKHKKGRWR